MDKGANINAYFYGGDDGGWYEPLIFKTDPYLDSKIERANKLELLYFLLELGADPNLKNSEGENLLHRFLFSEEQKFANALIDSGKMKDINEIIEYDKGAVYYGESALILAVRECYSSTVKKFIEAGAKSSLELLGSEEKLEEFKNEMREKKKYKKK
ncbi:ankyrin repeat domain-containing protein [Campylobacter taeniopygiae]|uniref:ankyrin repeat domain-containing protein n=1 Tax=Campylobacter taeniopygiae TaxID=2510188 RepID=UPI003D6B1299